MARSRKDGVFEVVPLPIVGQFNQQRFQQFGSEDTANWYIVEGQNTKRPQAAYPTMGRRHINYLGQNKLIFPAQPRYVFKTVYYWYAVVLNQIYRIDPFFNMIEITSGLFTTFSGNVFADYLVVSQAPPNNQGLTYICFVDGQNIYFYQESTNVFVVCADSNAPAKPTVVAAFGNRFVVAGANTSQFNLTQINLGGTPLTQAIANLAFTIPSSGALFAQEAGVIRQFGVLHNTLYIFTDYTTGIWANIPSVFTDVTNTQITFPWKKNSTYDWDYGIADPLSLDIDFGMMVWLGQNRNGLFQVMASIGDAPRDISTQAIDVLFQADANMPSDPFLGNLSDGFLYIYENTIFYRLSAGTYQETLVEDFINTSNSIEYNFSAKEWHRCIEINGERNRIQKHVYFNGYHLVTVAADSTIYQMSGQFYDNEITNPNQTNSQAMDAYYREPMRYERVTPIISEEDYSEFEDEYVEIDFVWGNMTFYSSTGPYENAQFIVGENSGSDGNPIFMISEKPGSDGDVVYIIGEQGNYPTPSSETYYNWFKPSIELLWSDNGGISFYTADVREFSQLGVYQWRMRWYQLGSSRNRCYKLVCTSPAPIVVLGGVRNTRRISGGAN
jgi:hypothetical protein